jgi:predicted Zn-dependent protease
MRKCITTAVVVPQATVNMHVISKWRSPVGKLLRVSGLSLAVWLAGCQSVNTTNAGAVGVERKQYMFSMLSAQQVTQMSAQAYQQTISEASAKGVLDKNSGNAKRVNAIAKRLIAQAPVFRPDAAQWDWQVNLIDSKELNANCGPGGKIIVYSGLIEQLQLSDDELAAVMGHEIAHALREHGREAMSKAYATQMAEQGIGALLGLGQDSMALADNVVQYSMTLPNSRANENEADLIGLELSARAGYNPEAAVSLWQKMAQASAGAPPEFMSTHPSSGSRIAALQGAIPKVMPLYQRAKGAN